MIDAMSDKEYNHYSKLLVNNPVYKKKKTNEGVFVTFNATKADTIRPLSIMNEMNKSEIGKELLEYINKENEPEKVTYSIINSKLNSDISTLSQRILGNHGYMYRGNALNQNMGMNIPFGG